MNAMRLVLGSVVVATTFACSQAPSAPDDDDGDSERSGSCSFDSVVPEMTCGESHDGMVCPGTVYCEACGMEVTGDCTCLDSGTSFGHQFSCEVDCAQRCGGAGGSGGRTGTGGADLTAEQMMCQSYCAAREQAACSMPSESCVSDCETFFSVPACYEDAELYVQCASEPSAWTCSDGEPVPIGCGNEFNTLISCLSG